MLVVRNIFQIKAGSMKEAVTLAKEGQTFMTRAGFPRSRALTDVVGDFYTLVLESECETLADFERGISENFGSSDWQAWYQRFTPLIHSGRREILNVIA